MNAHTPSTAPGSTPLADGHAGAPTDPIVDRVSERVQRAIRSTQAATDEAFDRLTDQVDRAHDQAAPFVQRVVDRVGAARQRGADAWSQRSHQLRDGATQAARRSNRYIHDEPVKAMLMAAAAAAAVTVLIDWWTRSRREP